MSQHVVFDFRACAMACRHCGAAQPLPMPISARVLVGLTTAFIEEHAPCKASASAPAAVDLAEFERTGEVLAKWPAPGGGLR